MRGLFEKILAILHVRSRVAGLEVSDEAVRLAYFDGKNWQMNAIRLEPGVMERGIIKNKDAFAAALLELKIKSGIGGRDGKKKANVVVAFSSANPYSKVFSLPSIEGDNLEKAVALNLDMASPGEKSELYPGWQIVNRDVGKGSIEILTSFIQRGMVDGIVEALFMVGFTPVAVESKALALTRVFREKGAAIDISKPYVFVAVDSAGVEFLVVKNGAPYFEYARHWADIADGKGEVTTAAFEDDLKASLKQVLNFYAQQWPEPLAAVVLSTVAFRDEVERTIAQNVSVPAVRLSLTMGQPISSEWLVALGSCLRGSDGKLSGGQEVSFLGEELQDRFNEEQVLHFLGFWQAIVPVSLAILAISFVTAYIFLGHVQADIEGNAGFTPIPSQVAAMSALEASSSAFNNEVAMIQGIESMQDVSYALIGDVASVAAANDITISSFSFGGLGIPIALSGIASSESQVVAFKSALENDKHVSGVDLPLTGIQPAGTNYSFSVTFGYSP